MSPSWARAYARVGRHSPVFGVLRIKGFGAVHMAGIGGFAHPWAMTGWIPYERLRLSVIPG